MQSVCDVMTTDTPESLKARVQALEGASFIEAIKMFQRGAIGPAASSSYEACDGSPHSPEASACSRSWNTPPRTRWLPRSRTQTAGTSIDAVEKLLSSAIKPFCKATL